MSNIVASRETPVLAWAKRLAEAGPPLLYGLKLAVAVSLALYVAFALQLDQPSWAGTSAGIVCQPIVGASMRKGVFRMVGTLVGAIVAVALTGIFPQNRLGFLVGMALWAALCAFGGTLSRNFAAYACALSGYTLVIIAGDSISEPSQVFHLAVTRATEIIVGITCAMAVMGLTDTGRAPARLAAAIDGLGGTIRFHFTHLLGQAGEPLPAGPGLRRALIGDVAAIDGLIDQAIGESPELRHRKAILTEAMAGLFSALSGWRIAETHLAGLPPAAARRDATAIAGLLPESWGNPAAERRSNGVAQRHDDLASVRALAGVDTGDVSRRLLAEAAADLALGLTAADNGLALLRDPASARDPAHGPGIRIADPLPALVDAIRTFVAIGAGILFWIVTAWPNGLGAVTFLAVTVLLLGPQQEKSGPAALGFGIGTAIAAALAAVLNFAILPGHESFPALALILSAALVPLAALSTVPALSPYLAAATMNLVPLVGPTDQITFDTAGFYNSALGIVGGCLAGGLALVLIPPVPRLVRAERLVTLTLRDLRRLARGRTTLAPAAWQHQVHTRLVALPEGADPVHGARLVAILSLGLQALRLRSLAGHEQQGDNIRAALAALAVGDVARLLSGLDRVDAALAVSPAEGAASANRAGRLRVAIQILRDVMSRHRSVFEDDAT